MSYCIDFFKKFKKDGNFCGLDKSQVSRLMAYLEIVEALVKQKIPEEQIYENFTVKAAEPLISAKGEAHTGGLNFVTAALKDGRQVTEKDVRSSLKSCINATTTPAVPVENAKKREPYNGTPQPGDFKSADPVPPPAPLAAQLKEKYAPVQNPPPNVANAGDVSNVEKTPCQEGKPCPAPNGRNYLVKQAVLGNKCDLTGSLVRNLTVCPIIQRQRAAEANGAVFTPAGQVRAPADERAPRELPRAAQTAPRQVVVTFTEKQWNILKQIQREDLADSFENAIKYLVDEAGERMGGA